MYKASGKVVIKETGVGVPDLQIVLYDIDNKPDKGAPSDPIEIFKSQGITMWPQIPGDRLGSTLTNHIGEFALEFDDADFLAREEVKQPDLMLLIMAPEDATPIGINPKDPTNSTVARVLHYSYEPIVNSGKNEKFIIRIPKQLLDKFQIRYDDVVRTSTPAVESIETALKQGFEFEQKIQSVFKQQTQERLKPALARKKKTDAVFNNFTFSKVAPEIRASSNYLNPGEKITDRLNSIFDSGLKTIPQLDVGAKRKLVLHLTEDQIRVWGLTVNNGLIDGEITVSKVIDHIKETTGGGTLEYSRPVLEKCSVRNEAERLFEETLKKCAAGPEHEHEVVGTGLPDSPPEEDGLEPLTTAKLLNDQITRQTKHLTSPEEELKYGIERDGEIVVTIPKGPADVTAYHDFHELQIAFEHVWTEAFDSSMLTLLKSAYSEMVKYKNRISGMDTLPIVANLQDMRSLYNDYLSLREAMESENESSNPNDSTVNLVTEVPQSVKNLLPEITNQEWSAIDPSGQANLSRLAQEYDVLAGTRGAAVAAAVATLGAAAPAVVAIDFAMNQKREDARAILNSARAQPKSSQRVTVVSTTSVVVTPAQRRSGVITAANDRLGMLMTELDQRLSEPHQFDIFAPNSMNYGMMVTYRQKWVPGNYQVGDMISTIPLAPKEVRKYTTKQTVKKSRTQKELEDSQSNRSAESSSTSRADTEITKQARDKTSFEATAGGTISVGVFQGQFGTQFGIEAEKSSSSTKKNFREAVLKASEEYKQQRRLEVETSLTEEMETTNSGEISNPNDEITVTYLFYELQRQYEISEKIHRLTPVILVANDVPNPDEIDEDWLIAKDWILRRVILDDSFLPALSYVTTSVAGDELALQILRDNVNRQVNLVEEVTNQVKKKTELADSAFQELKRLINTPVNNASEAAQLNDIAMAMAFGPLALIGSGGDDKAAEKREEIAKLAIERADKEAQEVSAKLSREVIALQEAIDKYTRALQEHFDRQTAIARLRIHIKDNIFFYMQAIWDYEPPDQRFFRLYNLDVPWVELEESTVARVRGRRVATEGTTRFMPIDTSLYEVELSIPLTSLPLRSFKKSSKKLSQIADLDNLLGYKGNYMIFPVKQASYLHTYMMQDYIDPLTGGLRDPDEFSNYTTDELLEYACCLQKDDPQVLAQYQEYLLELLRKRMATPRNESDLVVVPTGSAYIEALPGKHPILEDFKLTHRALDVKKVQAEVRNAELENIRLAARLLEGEREDPSIDKHILIEGDKEVDASINIDRD